MGIFIDSRRCKAETLLRRHPGAIILDLTSKSDGVFENSYAKLLSPFYPHGSIPVPGLPGVTATCVEAIWQGLKVFKAAPADFSLFQNDTMKNLKRTVRRFGLPLGHLFKEEDRLLSYYEARMRIYLPSYKWVLENVPAVKSLVYKISSKSKEANLVFLDYNTNADPFDCRTPISHAGLVKLYIEGRYPEWERRDGFATAEAWSQAGLRV